MPLTPVIYKIFRLMIHPIILLTAQVFPSLRRRWSFESKNDDLNDPFQLSFQRSGTRAERCYHVSSEGEWEQVWPFVLEDLREGLKTEILYTSESLEKRVAHSKQALDHRLIRFWRLPLLKAKSLHSWVSAANLVMCRYDFFPELIFLGLRCQRHGGEFVLLSGSLKGKEKMLKREGAFPFVYWSWLYQKFDRLCLASGVEKMRFMSLGVELTRLWSYEARGLQILLRLKNFRHTLGQRGLEKFVEMIEKESLKEERVIFGSFWPTDLGVLKQTLQKSFSSPLVVLAPHDLSARGIEELKKEVETVREVLVCGLPLDEKELQLAVRERKILIFTERGVLLELYPLFARAYVGGGFGRSVHSVLEPYLAQTQVYCGPKTHRSTEVDLIEFERPESLDILTTPEEGLPGESLMSDEIMAKHGPGTYYESLYETELKKLRQAREFLFKAKG